MLNTSDTESGNETVTSQGHSKYEDTVENYLSTEKKKSDYKLSEEGKKLNSDIAEIQNTSIRNCLGKIREKYKRKAEEKNKQLAMFESLMKVLNGQIDGLLGSTDHYYKNIYMRTPNKKLLAAEQSDNAQFGKEKSFSCNSEYDRIVTVRNCVVEVMDKYRVEAVEKNKQLAKTESLIKNMDDQTEFTRKRLLYQEELKKKKDELMRAEPQRNSIDDLIALSALEDTYSSNMNYEDSALSVSSIAANIDDPSGNIIICYDEGTYVPNFESNSDVGNSNNNSNDEDSQGDHSEKMNLDESNMSSPSKTVHSPDLSCKVSPSKSPEPKPKQPSRRSSLDMDLAIITGTVRNTKQPTRSDSVNSEEFEMHETDELNTPAVTTSHHNRTPSHSNQAKPKKGSECHFCDKCDQTFASLEALRGHKKYFHPLNLGKHKCPYCSYSSRKKNGLNVHMRLHTKERPFPCTKCPKTFFAKRTLIDHMNLHTGFKPFSCHMCEMTFTQRTNLRRHLRIHTDERTYICPVCYETFHRKLDLSRHKEQVHLNPKTYHCSICKLSFGLESEKVEHEKKLGDKYYECRKCKEKFHSRKTLKLHKIRKHTKNYPHRCKFCGKGFISPHLVEQHVAAKHT